MSLGGFKFHTVFITSLGECLMTPSRQKRTLAELRNANTFPSCPAIFSVCKSSFHPCFQDEETGSFRICAWFSVRPR